MSDDATRLFHDICRQHGGPGALGPVGTAIARALASLLSADDLDARGAASAAELARLLPPKPEAPDFDLTVLTDAELFTFAKLTAKVSGEPQPAKPKRVRLVQPVYEPPYVPVARTTGLPESSVTAPVDDAPRLTSAPTAQAWPSDEHRLFPGGGDTDDNPALFNPGRRGA